MLGGKLDTNNFAVKTIESINAAPVKPEFVVVTGDLTHHGRIEEMRVARSILDGLTMPYFALPGGHDDVKIFWEVFGDLPYLKRNGDVCYTIEDFGVRLVALETTSAQMSAAPQLGPARLEWLRGKLSEAPNRPTVLAMHHPPFQCRIPVAVYIEDPEVKWAEELKQIISSSTAVKLIVSGHVHRSIQSRWASTLVSVAPATCVQSDPRFDDFASVASRDKRTVSLTLEPPGYQFHWWNGTEFATFTMFTQAFKRI